MHKRIALALAAALLAVVGAELWARGQDTGRVQHVTERGDLSIELIEGVPVWRSKYSEERRNGDCVADAGGATVVVMGDSILFGVRLPIQESLGPLLQAALPGPAGCVHNWSEPAYALENQLALAGRDLQAAAPDVVVWELWENSPNRYTMVGDTAWNFGQLAQDAGGVPSAFGLPPAMNRGLFARSGLYRWLTLGRARPSSRRHSAVWQALAAKDLDRTLAVTRASGAALVLVLASRMDRPFAETVESGHPGYVHAVAWADAHGVAVVNAAAGLTDHAPEDLRLDTCCHMNARGTELLSGLVAPVVAAELAR